MDDVTNTMNTAAAAEPQQPAVRVRVVDATTRKTMNDISEVVFVPCADSEPIKIKNKALEQLPARLRGVKDLEPAVLARTGGPAMSGELEGLAEPPANAAAFGEPAAQGEPAVPDGLVVHVVAGEPAVIAALCPLSHHV